MKFFKNHPFAVEAFFDSSLVLTFAVPKDELENFIPECLELDTFNDKWAFIAIAIVQTSGLRPKGFPQFLGNNFFLIGHRIFARYTNSAGKRLRGLYILKSETNKRKMEFLGNFFTSYNYTTTDIRRSTSQNTTTIQSQKSNFQLTFEKSDLEQQIPTGSPFSSWKDARKFSGPLPHTFSYNETNGTVLIIEGVRSDWKPEPVKVTHYDFEFLNQLNFKDIHLASAFEVNNIPYYWKKGKIEQWK